MAFLSYLTWAVLIVSALADNPLLPRTGPALTGAAYLPAADVSLFGFSDAIRKARAAIDQSIQTGQSTYGPIDNLETSFSISVFSAETNDTIFDYHFEAPHLNGSCTKGSLTDDTIYRTGSLGKLMTVYAFLVEIGDGVFLDSVTKYIPELEAAVQSQPNDPVNLVNWDEVTVGALASQLAGLGRGYHLVDYALGGGIDIPPQELLIESGFPPVANDSIVQCSNYDYTRPSCDRKAFLEGQVSRPPTFAPYTKAAYSNDAYAIFGMVYENITGQSFLDAYTKVFQEGLGMTSTFADHPPADIDAIIPYNDTYAIFSYSLGLQWPAGSQYSSTRDLRTWGAAILRSGQLEPVVTRRWMKPAAVTGQWSVDVGAPWEIYRLPISADSATNTTRIVDLYTKDGDLGKYSTVFALDVDHQLVISVLAAGNNPNSQAQNLKAIIADIFINGAESAAKDQARHSFSGTFRATSVNSSITLGVDDGPGVVVTNWISNGTNFPENDYIKATDVRMYPAQLSTPGDNGTTYYAYRAQLNEQRQPSNQNIWPEALSTWFSVDSLPYDGRAVDAFVIEMDKSGTVQSVRHEGLKVTMYRAEK